ncbi:hypothetical protein U1Q18_026700 [Sarracenia purpurea var. burkii]
MDVPTSNRLIWEEIECSESFLVSCMYEEAASIASSVLSNLCNNKHAEAGEETQLDDMLESAGMVLVQSLKELGRTQDILNELSLLFGSVTSIPVQVILAGFRNWACFQIAEGPSLGTQQFLEEFLSKWRFVDKDELYYVLVDAESNGGYIDGSGGRFVLGVDTYLEVVEVYVVTYLGRVLGDVDHAISWVEEATLPEEKRQELLRRLQSLCSPKPPGSSQGSIVAFPADEHDTHFSSTKEQIASGGSPEVLKAPYPFDVKNDRIQAFLKLSQRGVPYLWWFRTVTLKFGNSQLVISNGKIVLGCLMILIYYVLQKKQSAFKRIFRRRALSIKKALVDLWQLAFSYQVNPLAAVQPIPAATRGSR